MSLGTNLLKLISKGTICPQELISNLDSPRELMSVWGPNGLAILSGSDVLRGPLFLGDLINVHWDIMSWADLVSLREPIMSQKEPMSLGNQIKTWTPQKYKTNYRIFYPCTYKLNCKINGTVHIFSCPQQLNRWPCHWLTNWLSHFYFCDITEWPKRLVTFETFDQSDEETWPVQHFDIFWQFSTI